jgi:hypothetical protein
VGNDCISGMQIALGPLLKAVQLELAGLEYDAFVSIGAANHEIVLVDVNRDVARPDLKRWVAPATLLLSCLTERRGASLWAKPITHRYERD